MTATITNSMILIKIPDKNKIKLKIHAAIVLLQITKNSSNNKNK